MSASASTGSGSGSGSGSGPKPAGRRILLADGAATEALGAALAALVRTRPGGVVYLHGDLGAGKTTLTRGLLRALGVRGPIRSPTYTLIEPYELADRRVLHMDLYRLGEPREFLSLGLEDQPPDQNWWWLEWPEKARGALPAPTLELHLSLQGEGRLAVLGSADPQLAGWLAGLVLPDPAAADQPASPAGAAGA